MEIFCYNPRKPRESIDQFNDRIQSFCLDHAVIGMNPQILGGQLVVSITLADDADMADANTLMPLIMEVESTDESLEDFLTEAKVNIEQAHRDSDPRLPIDVRLLPREDSPSSGYAVFYIVNGSVDAAEEA
mgnify:CR=1 FL=1